jgi:REP element-mobilizing transposase RayT
MANTYTQLDIHLVFAVKNRDGLIHKTWKSELYRYIGSIIEHHGHKPLKINGMPDHIHIFLGYKPTQLIPDLVEEIKTSSNRFVNRQKLVKGKFAWQVGYGAFSYSKSQRNDVIQYIEQQEQHHQKKSFREEYLQILDKFEVDYQDAFLFDFFDSIE